MNPQARFWALLLALGTISCDHATKLLARRTLEHAPPVTLLAGAVRLQYAENAGAFLSLGSEWPPALRLALFALGNGVVLLGLALYAWRRVGSLRTWELLALSLLVAGGVSNLLDRVVRGGVVTDFLNLGLGPVRTGIFNVADVAITIGALALLVAGRRAH